MSADYFPSFFLPDPVPSSSHEVNFDTNSFLCDPKPHFNQSIDSSAASVGSGDFSYLAPSSPSDCSLNSFDESNSSAVSVPRDDSMNSSISLYEPSHFPATSMFSSPRVGPSHSLLLSPQPAQPTPAAVKTKLEILSPRLTPAAVPVASVPAAANNANANVMPLGALPPSIFNMVLPLPMSGSSASAVASPATSTTALSPSPRSVSGNGSSSGPVDTEIVRELLKEQSTKKQRLARKAELARMSRKRKKTRLCDLEVEVAQLKDELEKERKARKVAENCLAIAQQQARMTAAPAQPEVDPSVAAENALVEESKTLHDQLRRQLASDSKEVPRLVSEVLNVVKRRQTHTAQQIRGLSRNMTPSLQLRFIEWALAQKDSFYADNSGLWNSLFVREVGLSGDQLSSLMNFRAAMQQQRAVAQEVQSAFAKFSAAFEQHNNLANESLAKFVSVFTPEQLAKFFSWVDTYGQVCVQINI